MQREELVQRIRDVQQRKIEKKEVELQSTDKTFPKQLYNTISAFSNQDSGGLILFGISGDTILPEITGVYDADDVEKKILENCQQMEPAVQPILTTCQIDEKTIVAAEIPGVERINRPVYYAGTGITKGSFVRMTDGTNRPMTSYEIYSCQAFRKQIHEDLRTVDRVNIRFFEQKRLKEYLKAVRKEHPKRTEELSDEDILEVMGVLYEKKPTLAGVISFSIYPQTYFPQLKLTAIAADKMSGNAVEQFTERKQITGAIPEIIDGAIDFVREHHRLRSSSGETAGRFGNGGYPEQVVREAVLNALLHRDYSVYTESIPVTLELYRDRLVIRNSGGLYGYTTMDELGTSRPEIRNPVLANILQRLNLARNSYSGIPMMRAEMKKAGLPPPEFREERGEFEVIFHTQSAVYVEKVESGRPQPIRLPERSPAAPAVRPESTVGQTVPAQRMPEQTMPESAMSGREMLPHHAENGHEEQTRQRIAEFCNTPRTRQELIAFTGVSRYYLISKYIQPMIEDKILAYTVPERPKSKFQKFVTIQK